MRGYKAILFAPGGDYVTDFPRDTKKEVIEALANKGSMWIFYPLEGIIRDWHPYTMSTQRLVDVAPGLPRDWVGKSISTVSERIAAMPEAEKLALLKG